MMNDLCLFLGVGSLKTTLVRIEGGLLHTMWRIDTTQGSFALKELSPKIDLANDGVVQNYNLTEAIAW